MQRVRDKKTGLVNQEMINQPGEFSILHISGISENSGHDLCKSHDRKLTGLKRTLPFSPNLYPHLSLTVIISNHMNVDLSND